MVSLLIDSDNVTNSALCSSFRKLERTKQWWSKSTRVIISNPDTTQR